MGDVHLPSAQKRYSDKSSRPAHFGRLSIAYNEEEKEAENKLTDEESTGQVENPEFYLHVIIGAAQE